MRTLDGCVVSGAVTGPARVSRFTKRGIRELVAVNAPLVTDQGFLDAARDDVPAPSDA